MTAASYAKLRDLTVEAGEPIEHIVEHAAHALQGLGEAAVFQLRLISGGEESGRWAAFSIMLSSDGAVVLDAGADARADLTVLTRTDCFRRIANGSYSPVQAYLDGELHLHGDVGLGKRIVRRLAGAGDPLNFCPVAIDETWQATGARAVASGCSFYNRQRKQLQRRAFASFAGI